METVAKWEMNYDKMLHLLHLGEPFAWMRYGDGEMRCVMQDRPGKNNTDGHPYYPDLGVMLDMVLRAENERQTCYIGLQKLGLRAFPDWKDRYPKVEWTDSEILHTASIKGKLGAFCEAIKGKHVCLIGPEHLIRLKGLPGSENWVNVIVPKKNAWQYKDDLFKLLVPTNFDVYLYSCGMMAEVIMYQMWRRMAGLPHGIHIDTGSVFDPYAGVNSRKYHEKVKP
jgi:hypothetical protein